MRKVESLLAARLRKLAASGELEAATPKSRADALAFARRNPGIVPPKETVAADDGSVEMRWSGPGASALLRFLGDGRIAWSAGAERGSATLFDAIAAVRGGGFSLRPEAS
jgi:hypothetical protein